MTSSDISNRDHLIAYFEERKKTLIGELAMIEEHLAALRAPVQEAAVRARRRTKAETEEIILKYFKSLGPTTGRKIREIGKACQLPYTSTHAALHSLLASNKIALVDGDWKLISE